MNNFTGPKSRKNHDSLMQIKRRAVSPIIGTLLLVAITVIGGSLVFAFSQEYFATSQISDSPNIESLKILGYDATDGDGIIFHDGFETTTADLAGNSTPDGLKATEYLGIYILNESLNKVTLGELRVAGDVYKYVDMQGNNLPTYTTGFSILGEAEYTIVSVGQDGSNEGITINSSSPSLEPGQQATIVLALEKDIKIGRDIQLKLSTTADSVFVTTINSGQQKG